MTKKFSPLIVLILLLGAAAPLAADIRFELGFGWTLVGPAMNATYINQYQPTLTPPDRYIASSADQTVRFKGKTAYGMNGFFNILFKENIGLQVLADYHRPGLGGTNTPYDVVMQFQASEPETYSRSVEWPASSGTLTETTFSLNALARFPVADDLSLSVSAGPSVFHFEGKAGYIGYTFFNLALDDGQYELTGGTYQMVVEFGPRTKYGMNVGIEAAYEAFRHVILAVDLRWYGAPKSALQMHVVEDAVITHPIEEIEATIGLGTLSVNSSFIRAGLAVRFIF
ncbi:MAG: hypothetical protein A2V76_00135 [Candidatus Aminicenantes bacterium RBG_16_63_14]|nr:MAG: hypothetical protein A2V76_00135 [Candidatus Aminicenantes bacterium RBG_16_63_14]